MKLTPGNDVASRLEKSLLQKRHHNGFLKLFIKLFNNGLTTDVCEIAYTIVHDNNWRNVRKLIRKYHQLDVRSILENYL